MGLRDRIKQAERATRGEEYAILQHDGSIKRFPASDGLDALLALTDGHDHPLAEACRNSPDSKWARSFYSAFPMEDVEDLSEQ